MAKKKPPKKKSLASRYSTQVQAEGKLRYDPQRQELRSALEDLAGELTSGVKTATAASEGQKRAAIAARPQIEGAYSDANTATDRAQTDLATKMGQLPGGGQLLSGAAARDAEGTKRRLAESLASARTELTDRQTRAAEGLSLQVGNLQGRFSSEAGKLRSKLQGVAEQEGTFRQGRTAELTGEERKASRTSRDKALDRGVTMRGQDLTHEDRQAAARKAKSKKAHVTPGQQGHFEDQVQAAITQARKLQKAGRPRSEVATLMVGGRPGQTVVDPKSGQSINVPGVEKHPQLVASIALDAVYDGHVSAANIEKAHKRKYKVKSLGIPTKVPKGTTPKPKFPSIKPHQLTTK